MNNLCKQFYLLSLFFVSLHAKAEEFQETRCNYFIYEEIQILCIDQSEQVGQICIVITPFFAVLHSLYVNPEHRNQGYGAKLIAHARDKALVYRSRVFIQPGPFEPGQKLQRDQAYQQRLLWLETYYGKFGFVKAAKPYRWGAGIIYALGNLNENSNYLMVYKS